ncbi:hypothetical protein [Natrinema pallidum]|uniref:Uncharacterized protein n=1 Tax=Natrinema pallidum TaxID=69527 RepID=A0A4P9TJX7_9EURY|nr:hypothetical protein [Natrinema pallidum]QCW05233.1 hypothetical protein FGF80_18465 [Natrinema pallidum]
MNRKVSLTTVACAALLILSLPVGVLAVQDEPLVTIDESNPLATPDAGSTYEETGTFGGNVSGYDMRVTVAETHSDAGLSGIEYTSVTDRMHHYLRVDYDEDIDRTIRFYVDSDVWYPHYRELEAENADVTASLTPVNDSEYTAVEITLTGPTDAVFQVPKVVSGYYYARDSGRSWLENRTGYEIPSVFSGGTQWERVDHDDLADTNESVAIGTNNSDPMIQYDTADDGQRWVPVPNCDTARGEDAPVCTYERPEDPDHVYVLADGDDPPPVRYKHGTDVVAEMQASVNELLEVPNRLMEQVKEFFGGDD